MTTFHHQLLSNISLCIACLILTSCYISKPVTRTSKSLHSDAIQVDPRWKKKPTIVEFPLTGAIIGAAGGYYLTTLDSTAPANTGLSKGKFVGLFSVAGAVAGVGVLFKLARRNQIKTYEEKCALEDRKKWLSKFNGSVGKKYVPVNDILTHPLVLVPKKNLSAYKEHEKNEFEHLLSQAASEAERHNFPMARSLYQQALQMDISNKMVQEALDGIKEEEFSYYIELGDQHKQEDLRVARQYYTRALRLNYNNQLAQAKLDEL